MKHNKIFRSVVGVCLAGALASCSSDYLELTPQSSVTDKTVMKTTETASYAVNGIAALMIKNQGGSGTGYPAGNSGEAFMMTYWGDFMGEDYFSNLQGVWGGGVVNNMSVFANNRFMYGTSAWGFYYSIISDANRVLQYLDECEETTVGERDQIHAELLTFRAHAYMRLLQLFAPRWSESLNGTRKCIVIRNEATTSDVPLSTMAEVFDCIYKDLDEAIGYFTQPEVAALERPNMSVPNLGVAYGTYARAALLKEDWTTAEAMAKNAREGYKIMTADEWGQGFIEANSDYMWTNTIDVDDYGYYGAWGAYNACNGIYALAWGYGAGAIDRTLYLLLDKNDIRRNRFLMPESVNSSRQPLKNWYDENYVNSGNMNVYNMAKNRLGSIAMLNFCSAATPNTPSWASSVTPAYSNQTGNSYDIILQFGAQLKFYCADEASHVSQYPFMRSTEMLLAQAEAAYHLGSISEAQQLVTELCKERITGYTSCTKTGQDLLDEIRLQRRIELWGEGSCFHDQKRWGWHNIRRAWVDGDTNSGNIPPEYAIDIAPDQANHWTLKVPYTESEYNKLINLSEIDWWN